MRTVTSYCNPCVRSRFIMLSVAMKSKNMHDAWWLIGFSCDTQQSVGLNSKANTAMYSRLMPVIGGWCALSEDACRCGKHDKQISDFMKMILLRYIRMIVNKPLCISQPTNCVADKYRRAMTFCPESKAFKRNVFIYIFFSIRWTCIVCSLWIRVSRNTQCVYWITRNGE